MFLALLVLRLIVPSRALRNPFLQRIYCGQIEKDWERDEG